MKFCKDCRHYSKSLFSEADCTHPKNTYQVDEIVYGKNKRNYRSCNESRGTINDPCGLAAKLFNEELQPEIETKKYCINCTYSSGQYPHLECKVIWESSQLSLADGKVKKYFRCLYLRNDESFCGIEGKRFSKKSFWNL